MNRQNSKQNNLQKNLNLKVSKLNDNVRISNIQLHELATNEYKFENKIKQLNYKGVILINQQKQNQALPFLLQAERILQYTASCGRTIDRILIITSLQNQACAYQRLWDLQKSSDYMQAIIFNIKNALDCSPYIQFDITVKNESSQAYKDLTIFINKRFQAAFYYLQFSAVNSQINKHKLALQSTRTALNIFQTICRQCLKYQKIKKGKNSILMEDLINSFSFQSQKPRGILAQTKQALLSLKRHRQFFSFDTQVIQNFTIGEVMQINTITVEQASKKIKLQDQINHLNIIYKVLYLSICYFVMGTQLRLISKQKSQQQLRNAIIQLNTSKIYHLYAIKVVSTLAPCQSKYLQHLVKSFKNHYQIDLYAQDFMAQEITKIQLENVQQYQQLTDRDQSINQINKIYVQKTKFNTFQTQQHDNIQTEQIEQIEQIGQSRQKPQKNIPNKTPKSPIMRNKKKFTKKDQNIKSRTRIRTQKISNMYVFPKKKTSRNHTKSKQKNYQTKNYQTKKSRQNEPISLSRQKLKTPINPEKISRVKKIKQQYYIKDQKNRKNIKDIYYHYNKSKEGSSLENERIKKYMNSRQKLIKFTKK